MDIRRLLIGMAIAMVLVVGWNQAVMHLAKAHPEWGWIPSTQPAVAPTPDSTATGVSPTTQMSMGTTQPATMPMTATAAGSNWIAKAPGTPTRATIGSAQANDAAIHMAINVSPNGAGLEDVQLNQFAETVDKPDRYIFQQPYHGGEDDDTRSLATREIKIDGETVDLRGAVWSPMDVASNSVTYRTELYHGVAPAVQIDKTYTLSPASTDPKTSQGYEVSVAYHVSNLTAQPISAVIVSNGPTVPPRESDRGDDRLIVGGYLHDGFAAPTHMSLTDLTAAVPTKDLSKDDDGQPMRWTGVSSVYFSAILRPDFSQPIHFDAVTATAIDPGDATKQEALLKYTSAAFTVPAMQSASGSSQVFFGPKKRELFESDYYAQPLLRYYDTLVVTSRFCGFLTFTPVIKGLYYLLTFFHIFLRDWGLAIIALVFLVRTCLHPITKRAQLNMAKMQKMGPEIEKLKKKHGDNKDELNKAMMGFYKTQGATPILGCLPMFLQMPIWIALYSSLQSTFALRQSPFLSFFGVHLTWIKDLAHPDRLLYFPNTPLNLLIFHVDALNVLPILLGCMSWIQAKITRSQQPPATTPEQAQQQKMMQWMVLMLPVILYNGPAGLNLYILTSTTFGIIEARIIRKHIKERQAAEEAGVVIIDAPRNDPPPTGTVRRKGSGPDVSPKKGGIMGWFAEMQAKAEEIRKEQEKRKKK